MNAPRQGLPSWAFFAASMANLLLAFFMLFAILMGECFPHDEMGQDACFLGKERAMQGYPLLVLAVGVASVWLQLRGSRFAWILGGSGWFLAYLAVWLMWQVTG